jgi:hypothetical protein
MRASAAASIRWRVAGVAGQWSVTTSLAASSASSGTRSASSAAAASARGDGLA